VLEFSLPASTYATMLLREVMQQPLEALNASFAPKPPAGTRDAQGTATAAAAAEEDGSSSSSSSSGGRGGSGGEKRSRAEFEDPAATKPAIHAMASRGFGSAADAYERGPSHSLSLSWPFFLLGRSRLFGFVGNVITYVPRAPLCPACTGRPDYPLEALAFVGQLCGLADASGSARVVLDLAAGTGKFTRLLAQLGNEHKDAAALQVLAVEPVPEMRAKIAPQMGAVRVEVRGGTAEQLSGIKDNLVDSVVVAQGWFGGLSFSPFSLFVLCLVAVHCAALPRVFATGRQLLVPSLARARVARPFARRAQRSTGSTVRARCGRSTACCGPAARSRSCGTSSTSRLRPGSRSSVNAASVPTRATRRASAGTLHYCL
jgi:hypothetical protein